MESPSMPSLDPQATYMTTYVAWRHQKLTGIKSATSPCLDLQCYRLLRSTTSYKKQKPKASAAPVVVELLEPKLVAALVGELLASQSKQVLRSVMPILLSSVPENFSFLTNIQRRSRWSLKSREGLLWQMLRIRWHILDRLVCQLYSSLFYLTLSRFCLQND